MILVMVEPTGPNKFELPVGSQISQQSEGNETFHLQSFHYFYFLKSLYYSCLYHTSYFINGRCLIWSLNHIHNQPASQIHTQDGQTDTKEQIKIKLTRTCLPSSLPDYEPNFTVVWPFDSDKQQPPTRAQVFFVHIKPNSCLFLSYESATPKLFHGVVHMSVLYQPPLSPCHSFSFNDNLNASSIVTQHISSWISSYFSLVLLLYPWSCIETSQAMLFWSLWMLGTFQNQRIKSYFLCSL